MFEFVDLLICQSFGQLDLHLEVEVSKGLWVVLIGHALALDYNPLVWLYDLVFSRLNFEFVLVQMRDGAFEAEK